MLRNNNSKILLILISISNVLFQQFGQYLSVEAAAATCMGDGCNSELTMPCEDALKTYEFGGSCCVLSNDPNTGQCTVKIPGGHSCYFNDPCNTGCTPACPKDDEPVACVIPYLQLSNADPEEECPSNDSLEFVALDREQPICTVDPCANNTESNTESSSKVDEEGVDSSGVEGNISQLKVPCHMTLTSLFVLSYFFGLF